MRPFILLALFCVGACGSAEIIAPSPLFLLDSYPGNGSSVRAGETTVAITLSEPVLEDELGDAILVEEVSGGGAPLREVPTMLESYSQATGTAVYSVDPLPADSQFQITLRSSNLTAVSGAQLGADLVRRFRTQAD